MTGTNATENGVRRMGRKLLKFLSHPVPWMVLIACAVGFVLRAADIDDYPPGLHADEASIAVEAASLNHFGLDRNGETFPVHFIAWGSGQNVLYAYILAPLISFGLSSFIIRLPMLIAGMLTLIVVFEIARKLFSPQAAVLAVFLMAISPWHIMLSRWALESNLFPFVFSLAFLCLLYADRRPAAFPVSMGLLGVSLYAYGTAYFLVPVFALSAAIYFWRSRIVSGRMLLLGIAVFAIIGFPILLFVLVNVFRWDEIHLGLVTIPRVVGNPRIIEMTGFLNGLNLGGYVSDFLTTAKILFLHTDELIYNSLPPFGFLFPGAIVLALAGAFLFAEKLIKEKAFGLAAFGAWLALAFLLGIIQPPTIHRINILFIPLILCVAAALDWLLSGKKFLAVPLALGLAVYGLLFWRQYTGDEYRKEIGWSFSYGLIPAVQSAAEYPDAPVCITNEMSMPYIYVELADFKDPREWLATIQYADPDAKFRVVEHMGRYSFGIQNCRLDSKTIYILKNDQSLPLDESLFSTRVFGYYVVYYPKAGGE
ncbi:MAG: glycosyltransferase family 39 protein [Anaerolineales bacterium]